MQTGNVLASFVMALGFQAIGQITMPPTPAPPPSPVFVAPPLPTEPSERQPNVIGPPPRPQLPPTPAWRDEKTGKLAELSEPLYWASLRRNPLVTDETWKPLDGYLARRKKKFEKITIDNLDLLRTLLGGAIEKAAFNKEVGREGVKGISELTRMMKPLVGDNIREDLKKRGILTEQQAQENDHVRKIFADEKSKELDKTLAPLPEGATPDQKSERDIKIRTMRSQAQWYQFIDESTWCYKWLLDEGGQKITEALGKTNFDGAVKTKIAPMLTKVTAAKDIAARIGAMQELVAALEVDQERELLTAIRSLRPPEPAGETEDEMEAAPAKAEKADQ